ncbi:GntR family transcriptional regulator [Oceanobacillus saliphilus]|uniref:GntR family transcriptional regulator n=1 Tax=Oceanobacillus saliphilus TaxID=2925834 RepID=UPI00201D90F3|nr:GntR family transcriptional regulator [Oceanobacillus saliphilus]
MEIWKKPKRPQSLRNQVIEQVVYAIANGHLKPGERIVEAELAQALDISRGPVREALSTLTQEGLVNNIPYRGTFVMDLNHKEIWEVCTLRATLEEFAVRRVIEFFKEETMERLWSHYDELVETVRSCNALNIAEMDMNFHEQLVRAAEHEYLYRAWSPLKYRVLVYSSFTIEKRYKNYDSLIQLHADLIRTIEEGDANIAASEIKKHIHESGEELLRHIKVVEENNPI